MAVYTEVPAHELEAFVAGYAIGSVVACKGIADGVENSNYLLHTTAGQFILTLYEKRVNPADLPFFLDLMDYLSARGIACPLPVKDKNGKSLNVLAGRPAAMVTFLEGMSVRQPDAEQCAQVGQALARFHAAGAGFAGQRPNALSVQGWYTLAAHIAGREDSIAAGLGATITHALADLTNRWPTNLPTGIIHADLFPDNVFFRDGHFSGMIDFYFACHDALAYDLAICLNAWCFNPDHSYNATKGHALLAAYHAERPLDAAEISALPLLAKGAALRFLLTRSVDWLNVPPGALVRPHDPVEYYKKLTFHNSVTDTAGYGWQP